MRNDAGRAAAFRTLHPILERSEVKPLYEVFPELWRKQPHKQLPVEEIVRGAWAHLVGAPVAARTEVFRLYKEILIVHVPDRNWKRQLHRLEGQYLARINQFKT